MFAIILWRASPKLLIWWGKIKKDEPLPAARPFSIPLANQKYAIET